jgi:CATRA-associated small protein
MLDATSTIARKLGPMANLPPDMVSDASSVLDVFQHPDVKLSEEAWERVHGLLERLVQALAADDSDAAREAIGGLEVMSPPRRLGPAPVSATESRPDVINTTIERIRSLHPDLAKRTPRSGERPGSDPGG